MRTFAAKMGLGQIAVVAENLESLGVIVGLEPTVYATSGEVRCSAVFCAVILNVVHTQERHVRKPATRAFATIRQDHCSAELLPEPLIYGIVLFGILFAPRLVMSTKPLSDFVIMLEVVGPVASLFASQSFFGGQFCAHKYTSRGSVSLLEVL